MLGKLKTGDGIGIFSASAPVTYWHVDEFNRGKDFLKGKGFRIIEGRLTGKYDHYRSGSIRERAAEINDLIRNEEVRCLMAAGGGWVSNSILPYLDYQAFVEDPKIMIGFSDITAIVLGFLAMTGITTFYGADVLALSEGEEDFREHTYQYFRDILMEKQVAPYTVKMPPVWKGNKIDPVSRRNNQVRRINRWRTVLPGRARGRLIGGNLNTIMGIWGSKYMPEIRRGDILLLEDAAKDAATVEKSFSLLKLNGIFEKVNGIILGKHDAFDGGCSWRKPYDILLEVLAETRVPILAEFDCSHTIPLVTLPIGAEIELDATRKEITILTDWIEG